jgi:quinolinate synthase
VRKLSDVIASTSGMVKYPEKDASKEYIIATETGILYQLKKKYPDREFYPAYPGSICPNMKLTSLEKILWCLEEEKDEIVVPAETAKKAGACIKRMLKSS